MPLPKQRDDAAVIELLEAQLRLLQQRSATPARRKQRRGKVDNDVSRHPLLPARNAWLDGQGCLIVAAHSPRSGTRQVSCLRVAAFAKDHPGNDYYYAALDAARAIASEHSAGCNVRVYQVRRAHAVRETRLIAEYCNRREQ